MPNNRATARAFRLRHHQGQHLQAADLQNEYDNLTWLRSLHVLGLHDTWGIALGFSVQSGPKKSNTVLVGPGLAYDCWGREIVLTQTHPVAGPQGGSAIPNGTVITLVMRYDADLGQREAGLEWAPCNEGVGQPRRERPLFAWRRAGTVRLGLEVPLLALRLQNGQVDAGPLDQSERHYAQAVRRPHIAAGVTPPEQPWKKWQFESSETKASLGFQTWVDTSDAGFVGATYYQATLRIPTRQQTNLAPLGTEIIIPSVAEESASGFRFRLLYVRQRGDTILAFANDPPPALPLVLQVSWVGVELVDGCRPPPRWESLIRLIEQQVSASGISTPTHVALFDHTSFEEPTP